MSLPLKELINLASAQLKEAGIHDHETDAKELYMYLMGMDKIGLMMHWTDQIQDNRMDVYMELVEKRAAHTPLQHITGTQEFMGLTFKVNENVLIPRMDTETVVEEAMKYLDKKCDVLDLCTGSGAIGIAISRHCPKASVTLSDISEEALKVAKENAALNHEKVKIVHSDMLDAFKGRLSTKKFDMIISNPPYIVTDVIDTLDEEVKDHEPMKALDGGKDGLDFYRIIAREAPKHLRKDGMLVLEIGYDQGETVPGLLTQDDAFTDIEVKKDLAGNDRVVIARLK